VKNTGYELSNQTKAWTRGHKAWNANDALPQTAEEAVVWKQLEKGCGTWRALDQRIGELAREITKADSAARRKELFQDYHEALIASRPAFKAAEDTLEKLVDMNAQAGEDAVKEAQESSTRARSLMYTVSAI